MLRMSRIALKGLAPYSTHRTKLVPIQLEDQHTKGNEESILALCRIFLPLLRAYRDNVRYLVSCQIGTLYLYFLIKNCSKAYQEKALKAAYTHFNLTGT